MKVVYLQPTEDQFQSNAQSAHAQSLAACTPTQTPYQNCKSNLEQVDEAISEGAEDHVVVTKSMHTQRAQSFPNLNQVVIADQIQPDQGPPSVQIVNQDSVVNISDSISPQRPVDSVVDGGSSDPNGNLRPV